MIRKSFPVLRIGRGRSFKSEDLDDQLEKYIARGTSTKLAPIVSDETFVRRVYIDVTGSIPRRFQVQKFLNDKSPNKREKTD